MAGAGSVKTDDASHHPQMPPTTTDALTHSLTHTRSGRAPSPPCPACEAGGRSPASRTPAPASRGRASRRPGGVAEGGERRESSRWACLSASFFLPITHTTLYYSTPVTVRQDKHVPTHPLRVRDLVGVARADEEVRQRLDRLFHPFHSISKNIINQTSPNGPCLPDTTPITPIHSPNPYAP